MPTLRAPDPNLSTISVGHFTGQIINGVLSAPDVPDVRPDASEDEVRAANDARTILAHLSALGFTPAPTGRTQPAPTPPPSDDASKE